LQQVFWEAPLKEISVERHFSELRPSRRGACGSGFVHLAPVRNARNFHFSHFIVDDLDHAVIADADAPRIFAAFELD
jgi:hypothetical protein